MTGRMRLDPSLDNLPPDKPSPGWWPRVDYPEWLALLMKVIRRHNPAADIVFWTYNWGYAPETDLLALIRALPTDVTLQVTFEMFEPLDRDGIRNINADYTASSVGPGHYFASAARADALGEQEIAIAEATIPLVEADSRLGWEPSMEYLGDAAHLRWKIEQARRVLTHELLPTGRRSPWATRRRRPDNGTANGGTLHGDESRHTATARGHRGPASWRGLRHGVWPSAGCRTDSRG